MCIIMLDKWINGLNQNETNNLNFIVTLVLQTVYVQICMNIFGVSLFITFVCYRHMLSTIDQSGICCIIKQSFSSHSKALTNSSQRQSLTPCFALKQLTVSVLSCLVPAASKGS